LRLRSATIKIRTFFFVLATGALSACSGHVQIDEHLDREFLLAQTERQILDTAESLMREQSYRWIFHVHFSPNDFGVTKSWENSERPEVKTTLKGSDPSLSLEKISEKTKARALERLARKDLPFDPILPAGSAALNFSLDFHEPMVIGQLSYRHSSYGRALKAFTDLFQCEGGRSEILDQTLLIGSGGSHGGSALQTFAGALMTLCGKRMDWVVLGDAIHRPLFFAMNSFGNSRSRPRHCWNFYQRRDILKGNRLESCFNVRYDNTSRNTHDQVAAIPEYFVTRLLERVRISEGTFELEEDSVSRRAAAKLEAQALGPFRESTTRKLIDSDDDFDRLVAFYTVWDHYSSSLA